MGEAIAGLISHPPGVNRCEVANVCGPAGLIVSARTSNGTVDNLLSVNDGGVESGLAQSDVVAAAVKGTGPFKAKGKQSHLRVIASLFSEDVHLVVREKAKIKSVADLKGKRVSLGLTGSGVGFTAREILTAYHVPEARLKALTLDTAGAIALMKQIAGRLLRGRRRADRRRRRSPGNAHGQAGAHHGAGARSPGEVRTFARACDDLISGPGTGRTVSTRALWIVRDSVPEGLVYGITRALFNPANREALSASHPSARDIGLQPRP